MRLKPLPKFSVAVSYLSSNNQIFYNACRRLQGCLWEYSLQYTFQKKAKNRKKKKASPSGNDALSTATDAVDTAESKRMASHTRRFLGLTKGQRVIGRHVEDGFYYPGMAMFDTYIFKDGQKSFLQEDLH